MTSTYSPPPDQTSTSSTAPTSNASTPPSQTTAASAPKTRRTRHPFNSFQSLVTTVAAQRCDTSPSVAPRYSSWSASLASPDCWGSRAIPLSQPTNPARRAHPPATALPTTTLPTTTTTTATDTLQDQILADGVVTEIELTASQDATVACIEAGGFNAYYGGPDGHSLISSAPDTKTDQLHRVVETCEASNWTRVSMRYASGHLPETFDMEAIWTCLRDSDLVATSDNDPTTAFQQALSINPRAAENCIKPGRPALTPPT